MPFDGKRRSYLVHLPAGFEGQGGLPMVIVIHGGAGNGERAELVSEMSAKADREGFIAVYPDGTGRFEERLFTWNAGLCCGVAQDNNEDDVGYFHALLDELEESYRIDSKRVFVAGISNGAMMAYRLACEMPERIAAIAPVAGSMVYEPCNPVEPVSVAIFHGTADLHVLYDGGAPEIRWDPHERIDLPVSFAVDFWVAADGCSPEPETYQVGNIVRDTYSGGHDGSAVVLYTINGGGHSWPGGTRGWLLGEEPTQEVSATDEMWEFFQAHPKP